MTNDEELLPKIRSLLSTGKYRIRIHAVRHMVEEGFTEREHYRSYRRQEQNPRGLFRRKPLFDHGLFSLE